MTEQPAAGTVVGNTGAHGLDAQTGQTYVHEEYHGRRVSWVAATLIIVGFIIGGIALPAGPTWWLFWLGTGIVVIGGIFALSVRILDDWY